MRTLNRTAIVVRPKEPYIRWAERLQGGEPNLAIRGREAVYLLDDPPEWGKTAPPFDVYAREIFEAELTACSQTRAEWPEDRSPEAFAAWFRVSQLLVPVDLGRYPLAVEES